MELDEAPKQFCDNIKLSFSEESFLIGMSSGSEGIVYAFTTKHAKRFMQMLSSNIDKYEKHFGEIKTQWSEDISSPLQPKDINGDKK